MLSTKQAFHLDLMQKSALEATRILRTLANTDRLLLLCFLSQGEYAVCEISSQLGITQPTLSQQLTVLRTEELVKTRREGKHIYYSISDSNVLQILQVLYTLYCPQE